MWSKFALFIDSLFSSLTISFLFYLWLNRIYKSAILVKIISILIDFFDSTEKEDGCSIKILKNTPIRIVYDDYKPVAIGHFIEDRFLQINELLSLVFDYPRKEEDSLK